jgi:hypothetical protein
VRLNWDQREVTSILFSAGLVVYFVLFLVLGAWFARANYSWVRVVSTRGLLPALPPSWRPAEEGHRQWSSVGGLIRITIKALRLLRQPDGDPETERWRLLTQRRFLLVVAHLVVGLLIPVGLWLGYGYVRAFVDFSAWASIPFLLVMLSIFVYSLFRLVQAAMVFGSGGELKLRTLLVALARVLLVLLMFVLGGQVVQ